MRWLGLSRGNDGVRDRADYRRVRWGHDALAPGTVLPRHRHAEGYATVILDGVLCEASFSGRHRGCAGEVLLHASFDCHSNPCVGRRGTRIIRLPWTREQLEGRLRTADPDLIARLAERDPLEATCALEAGLEPVAQRPNDWPALLAAAINADPSLALLDWARAQGLGADVVSRGFRRAFGTSPRAFRLESRTRQAWRSVVSSTDSLTDIAHAHAFADLSHMSRSIRSLTGRCPLDWRRERCAASPRTGRGRCV